MFIFYIPGKFYPASFNCFMDTFYLILICRFSDLHCNLCYAFRKQTYDFVLEYDILEYLVSSRKTRFSIFLESLQTHFLRL